MTSSNPMSRASAKKHFLNIKFNLSFIYNYHNSSSWALILSAILRLIPGTLVKSSTDAS